MLCTIGSLNAICMTCDTKMRPSSWIPSWGSLRSSPPVTAGSASTSLVTHDDLLRLVWSPRVCANTNQGRILDQPIRCAAEQQIATSQVLLNLFGDDATHRTQRLRTEQWVVVIGEKRLYPMAV